MPTIIAILLALLTKEVYLSLFAGCALGALLVAEFHPWVAFDTPVSYTHLTLPTKA